ncbi:hypothetical protein MMC18_000466 [Xylographa bjoerkii]|nr:hypothetical protein [Xylographa bjoerkii]
MAPKKVAVAATKTSASKTTTQEKSTKPTAQSTTKKETRGDMSVTAPKAVEKTTSTARVTATNKNKRKAEEHEDGELNLTKTTKRHHDSDAASSLPKRGAGRPRKATTPAEETETVTKLKDEKPKKAAPPVKKPKAILNHAPTQRLNVYVFGANSGGELGLGRGSTSENVTRPRLNPNLSAESVGIVQLATGGMHCAALTHDNKILTWGVNDMGALGRDTIWEGGMVDMKDDKDDAGSDSDTSESAINPREATPTAILASDFPEGIVFTQVAAGDNATFALTEDGLVYGWGSFRGNDGILGFSPTEPNLQARPVLIQNLKKVTKLVVGSNHVLALTASGALFSWGAGEQNQLGRRIVERTRLGGLIPRQFGFAKGIVDMGAGAHHSFAIHKNGKVYGWGLNSYGETGIDDHAGENEATILKPTVVESLSTHGKITCISGGNHHTVAVTEQGVCLAWGRIDAFGTGLKIKELPPDDVIFDDNGKARILTVATPIPGLDAAFVAAGSDHSIAVTKDGKAYSWGFSADYQTGLGKDDDVECATLIDNTAIRGKHLTWAGAGGQYSVLAGEAATLANGDT